MAQDDYYYEIQLTNKQLVFYFMAGATGLILSFLAGVMVGKGVESSAAEVQAARPVAEEKIVAEETPPAKATAPPSAQDLTYAQRLESDKVDDTLERAKPGVSSPAPRPAPAKPSPVAVASASRPASSPPPAPRASAAPVVRPSSSPERSPEATAPSQAEGAGSAPVPAKAPATEKHTPKPASGTFTIQVGAFKDKASADSVVARLKGKGFAAYVVTPETTDGGLFNVRVGSYPARVDAERVQAKLRDQEKFKPFIVKN